MNRLMGIVLASMFLAVPVLAKPQWTGRIDIQNSQIDMMAKYATGAKFKNLSVKTGYFISPACSMWKNGDSRAADLAPLPPYHPYGLSLELSLVLRKEFHVGSMPFGYPTGTLTIIHSPDFFNQETKFLDTSYDVSTLMAGAKVLWPKYNLWINGFYNVTNATVGSLGEVFKVFLSPSGGQGGPLSIMTMGGGVTYRKLTAYYYTVLNAAQSSTLGVNAYSDKAWGFRFFNLTRLKMFLGAVWTTRLSYDSVEGKQVNDYFRNEVGFAF